jgi:methylase of polypeptide subunit release factors
LLQHVVSNTIGGIEPGAVVRVLDPACGDGRFLFAAARAIVDAGATPVLTGVDIDLAALRSAEPAFPIEAIEADALSIEWGGRRFDVVVGNPPFLSQLARATARVGGSRFGGGPYADAAADFLALSLRLADRVGLVLPNSLLTARDAGRIRRDVLQSSHMTWFWSSPTPVFAGASVLVCAVGFQRGAARVPVRRSAGPDFRSAASVVPPARAENDHWGWLIADSSGVPSVRDVASAGTVSDRALVTANFRDQYYGLVGAVSDDALGPPLITTGLIDPGVCHWGRRPTRFAKQRFDAPRVDPSGFSPFMQRWAERCLVPKVLVATQSRVLEAVVDEAGHWLPAVPVVRAVPHTSAELWPIAAMLTSPVASALIAHQSVGSGLSPSTVRVSQRTLGALPWPAGDLSGAAEALRAGDLFACGRAVDAAYGVADQSVFDWWANSLSHIALGGAVSTA